MSTRLRNNLIAGLIVFAFWCISFSVIAADPIVTQATSNSTVTSSSNSNTTTRVKTNPPSAISPSLGANTDCTYGISGSVQSSVIGMSTGQTVRDINCENLALSSQLYDMGLKIAAIEILCLNDYRVFQAMQFSSTPCSIPDPETGKGLLGLEARAEWAKPENHKYIPKKETFTKFDKGAFFEKVYSGILGIVLIALLAL
tara:strand:+ start:32 stop:631 length:600 start_codon:yes stop_codon:yes gene_type:complete